MSRKAPAVQVYVEDFLGGTRFMSNAEVGLYTRLLFEQVDNGPIPDNVEHFVKAYGKECRKLWATVRSKFVDGPMPGTIINERMAKAIADRDAFRQRQSDRGKASAEARLNRGSTKHKQSLGSTVVEPLGDGVGINTSEKERASKDFDEFYAAYPVHKAKGNAVKAWARLTDAERTLCLPAIAAQVKAQHFRGADGKDYIPHPASWLNARRWEDEVKIPTGEPAPTVRRAAGWLEAK